MPAPSTASAAHVILLGAAVVLAAPAMADDCATLRRVMEMASSNFAQIRGAFEDTVEGDRFYAANVSLRTLPNCGLQESSEGRTRLNCSLRAPRSSPEAIPLDAADRLVQSCQFRLRDSSEFTSRSGRSASKTYEVITDRQQLVIVRTSTWVGSANSPRHVSLSISRP